MPSERCSEPLLRVVHMQIGRREVYINETPRLTHLRE